jgi:endonuclease/exonuclease/phosphatase family metal-dependent hydrolase
MKRAAWLAVVVAVVSAALACSGGGASKKTATIVVIDQNVLHGLINEDPAAEPNDRFAERIQLIADALAQDRPEVAALQEVRQPGDPATGYPDPREVLLGALGAEYKAVFGNFLGSALDEEGLGQLTLTRLPIISSENRSVSAIRSVHRVTLQTDVGPVHVYNAHLEGTGAVLETGGPAELQEIENVISFINETRNGGPAILAGDMNSEPDDPAIQRLLRDGFVDALAAAGDATCAKEGDAGCSNSTIPLGDNEKNLANVRIDYIFVLPGDSVTATVTEASRWNDEPVDAGDGKRLWLSDHIGMRAVIKLKEK